ncbi:hypothetical protein AEQ67_28890 [Pseudomonas sp. RIT-PI-q]|nr:hypothetical protein AEQ67_28890 [Pseudomonas sp. RIT-PI-q]
MELSLAEKPWQPLSTGALAATGITIVDDCYIEAAQGHSMALINMAPQSNSVMLANFPAGVAPLYGWFASRDLCLGL